jgi:serine/threonine-protein kinase
MPESIDNRYRVEAELGRGATARVYRVLDERSGKQLALKQLTASGEHVRSVQAMFEREYHTLAQLAHPHIVRAFDYGLDGESAYYTMELLEGKDARETLRGTTLTVRQICLLLRDAASALALIHSRRLVHRDISPRNLFCEPNGRAKLIDFGTLVAMGPQTRVAGTAPFVPPEALYLQPLDARSDLYALGALAYFMLTQRQAYSARHVAELREVWQRRPERPDALRPELPAAISDLVMSLLSLDARGRPASAAEVCERLSAAGDLPAEDERHFAQAFLASPKLVGREQPSGLLRMRLLRAIRGRGSAASIVAAAGLGRSRMIASTMLEAKLLGAVAITVDGAAVGTGPFSLAGAIAQRLLEALPQSSPAAPSAELAAVLAHVSPELPRALGLPAPATSAEPPDQRALGAALLALFEGASRAHRLVIAIDDVQRADGPSLGVLGRLALFANDHHLLVVTSCDEATLAEPPPALAQLLQPESRVALRPLEPDQTRELLESLFGAAPGLEQAASWLHELSQGNPQTCMLYAQHLVDRGLARYERGQWKLPERLREHGLPPTLGAMLEARIAAVSDDARALAFGLALARDKSRSAWQPEIHVRIEDFPKLLEHGDSSRAFSALDELLRAGMVQQRDSYYVLSQSAMADALLRVSGEDARRRMHARLAAVFEHGDYPSQMLAVHQLQLAGEDLRARELVAVISTQARNRPRNVNVMRVSVSAECAQRALTHWETHGGSPREGILLRSMVLLTCSVYDWSAARCGQAQLARLQRDIGLEHWDETDSALPDKERVLACVQLAQHDYEHTPPAERGLPPSDALRELSASSLTLSGAFVNSHDLPQARSLPGVFERLRTLSPLLTLFAENCALALDRVAGREIGERLCDTIARIGAAEDLPPVLRFGARSIYSHLQSLEDARRGRERAFEYTDIVAANSGEGMFLALHGRWLAHAFLGQAAAAQRFQRQAEVITEDDVWRRKATLFVEAELHALTGDLLALQRVHDAIAELAPKFPGWRPWLLWTSAEIHRLRGELEASARELRAALEHARAGEHRAYSLAAPAYAELLLMQGDVEGARREAQAVCNAVATLGLDLGAAIVAGRVRALAESKRGDHAAAQATLELAFEQARALAYGGLPLARLCETQARIALAAREAERCARALGRLRSLLEHADAPALLNAYEALREQAGRQLEIAALPIGVAVIDNANAESSALFTDVQLRLRALPAREQRVQQALRLLFDHSGVSSGYLFLFDASGAVPAAVVGCAEPSTTLFTLARQYLDAELSETSTAVVTVPDATAAGTMARALLFEGDAKYEAILLSHRVEGRPVLTGLALLTLGETKTRTPPGDLARAISHCLEASGDSVAVAMDG